MSVPLSYFFVISRSEVRVCVGQLVSKLIAEDILNGFVSMEATEKTDGVIFSKDGSIDPEATESYRSEKAIQ